MFKTKSLLCVLLSIILCVGLAGCKKVVNTETEVVEAEIIDIDRDPMRPMGTAIIPADFDILLKYEGIELWVDISRDEYHKYEDSVGTTIEVNLITTYYDDGTQKYSFELIKG